MDIVSFETAKKIKEAGFPQPHPGDFQFWYVEDNKNKWEVTVIVKCGGIQEAILNVYGSRIFAPTATDILMLLSSTRFYFDKIWRVHWFRYNTVDEFKHEDPAEACALAWLAGYREPIKMPVHTITCMTDSSLSVGNVESK